MSAISKLDQTVRYVLENAERMGAVSTVAEIVCLTLVVCHESCGVVWCDSTWVLVDELCGLSQYVGFDYVMRGDLDLE
jgi:hypothetical protein